MGGIRLLLCLLLQFSDSRLQQLDFVIHLIVFCRQFASVDQRGLDHLVRWRTLHNHFVLCIGDGERLGVVDASVLFEVDGDEFGQRREEVGSNVLDVIGAEVEKLQLGIVDEKISIKGRQLVGPQAENPEGWENFQIIAADGSQARFCDAQCLQVGEVLVNIFRQRHDRRILDVERFDVLVGFILEMNFRDAVDCLVTRLNFEIFDSTSVNLIKNDPVVDRILALELNCAIEIGENC